MLTPEIVRALRTPFPPAQIKWKLQTNPRAGSEWAIVVAYIDARDVAERLDRVTGGDWSGNYAPAVLTAGDHISLMYLLTVCGTSRRYAEVLAEFKPWCLPRLDPEEREDAIKAAVRDGATVVIAPYTHVSEGLNLQVRDHYLGGDGAVALPARPGVAADLAPGQGV